MNQLRLNRPGKTPTLLRPESLKFLQDRIRGRIVTAADESFDTTRKVWNGLIDKKPGAIIEEQDSLLQGAYGPNLKQLRSIKKKFNPMNLFAGAIKIQPEGPVGS